jgi:hypothetical protein
MVQRHVRKRSFRAKQHVRGRFGRALFMHHQRDLQADCDGQAEGQLNAQ